MDRREFLKYATISSLSLLMPGTRGWAYSTNDESAAQKKLIVVLLRGGMDGLNVVVPYGDREYYQLRPTIALPQPGRDRFSALDLDGHFGLNPAMAPLMPLWENRSLAFVHASGSPDPTRSHFDAQDYMESGMPGNRNASTGWVNRLLTQLPKKNSPVQAVSIGPVLPRICQGPASIATIATQVKQQKNALDRPVVGEYFTEMYAGRHTKLASAFSEGMAAHKEINEDLGKAEEAQQAQQQAAMQGGEPMDQEQKIANHGAPLPKNNTQFGKQMAQLFHSSPALQVAFMDFGGWDTHINEGNGNGTLAKHLSPLAQGLADLVEGLGPMYRDTTIVVMSEFGRTAKENGNNGTDHGHGNVMWIMGGGTQGGKVFGRWNGLSPQALHEGRDLPTTTDFRSVLANVLNEQVHIPHAALAQVFPDFKVATNPFVQT